jgi:hypothetical protein
MKKVLTQTTCALATMGWLSLLAGCQTSQQNSAPLASVSTQPSAPSGMTAATTSTPMAARGIIRIKAGSTSAFTDSSGNIWQGEKGFNGGDVIERDAGLAIANTKEAGLFRTEHYGMDSVSLDVPNGKYLAKLYFAETFDGISGAGGRVFSFNVQGHEFKDFDVWAKAGGANRAYVESVPVAVTEGKFKINFTSNVENPEINAIELIPQG